MRPTRWWMARARRHACLVLCAVPLCALAWSIWSPDVGPYHRATSGQTSYLRNEHNVTANTSESFIRDGGETFALKRSKPQNIDVNKVSNLSQTPGSQQQSVITNSNVHVFYYAWYGNPQFDGQWWHWNHEYIPPWDKKDHKVYPTGAHRPPADIGANFYPTLGPYSSRDPAVIDRHMSMVSASGAGVVSVSWYPPGQADEHGPPSDGVVPLLLEAAARHGLALCLHVEPYEGRGPETLRRHLRYVAATYGAHPAYYRRRRGAGPPLPVFYIYDSYRTPPQQWARLLSPRGDLSVRGTDLDAIFLGLLVDYKHRAGIKQAGFDGFYTYFAADGFSHGSSWRNWRGLASWARKSSLEFVPSVGPGYLDTRVRAWNSGSTRARRAGRYYEAAWGRALEVRPTVVSVTSFNEWHEGTQIEPAVAASCDGYSYEQYGEEEGLYLRLTNKWAGRLANLTRSP